MLYIFQVDTGQMLCFEMDVAISTVNTLKSKIATTHGIPVDKQVLLVSGGEILEGGSRVCNYAAGTDTNPIFLFNKLNIEGGALHQPDVSGVAVAVGESMSQGNVQMADLETIHKQIENTNNLPPTYMSVVTRAQLAQHVYEMGKEITRKCEVLIHHQHLQHQGWAAVVANLDDIVGLFSSKLTAFVGAYEGFCKEYTVRDIDSFVDGLDPTLKTLDTIKIPDYYVDASNPSTDHQKSVVTWLSEHYSSHKSNTPPPLSQGQTPLHAHLQSTATSTRKTYDHITCPNFLQSLQQEAASVMEKALSTNMKEIKGLEERLYGLDQLLQEAKNLVVDQHELTQAFHQNVSRASDLRDSSIFPDLCASHQHQLLVMYKNHSQLEDIRRRCARAKEELTYNLNTRLKWVAFVQKSLSEMGGKIGVYHESLRRLRVNVNILQQIHECEEVYHAYVKEVNCRGRVGRKLSGLVGKIAEFNGVVERENARRGEFRGKYGGHFLSQAFNVLIEDREVGKVNVPGLVDYVGGDGEDMEEDGGKVACDPEKDLLRGRVKELEGVVGGLNCKRMELEGMLAEKVKCLELERDRVKSLVVEVEMVRGDAIEGKGKVERLSGQVEDLKRLIDEFRVKEDDNIRMRQQELAEFNEKVRETESKCNDRVVELTRMLEFECSQKIKTLEENHKMEMVAMVKRFKLVNECSQQKIRQSESGGGPHSPIGGRGRITSESDGRASAFASSREIVFSDDEDSDVVERRRGDSIRMEEDDGGDDDERRRGSLEKGQDAALMDESVSCVGQGGVGVDGISDRVISIATRLNKLSRVSVTACRVDGQPNLFYWNDKFNAFTVYLTTRSVHFLNTSERSSTAGDRGSGSEDDQSSIIRKLSKSQVFVANITDKEFCVARRAQNRYNVDQGFHFYRVKCKVVEVLDD